MLEYMDHIQEEESSKLNELKEKQMQDKLQTFVDELIADGIVSVETR